MGARCLCTGPVGTACPRPSPRSVMGTRDGLASHRPGPRAVPADLPGRADSALPALRPPLPPWWCWERGGAAGSPSPDTQGTRASQVPRVSPFVLLWGGGVTSDWETPKNRATPHLSESPAATPPKIRWAAMSTEGLRGWRPWGSCPTYPSPAPGPWEGVPNAHLLPRPGFSQWAPPSPPTEQ